APAGSPDPPKRHLWSPRDYLSPGTTKHPPTRTAPAPMSGHLESQSTGKRPLLEAWATGEGMVALWAMLMAVAATGTVAAWRSLDRPLPPDALFPPVGRPAAIASPGWLADPDDPNSWRYWDGRMWTGWTAPIRPSGGAGAPDGEPARSAVPVGGASTADGPQGSYEPQTGGFPDRLD
ncbi:MAG: DUF2510 domain-containing protein, partial [Candidatus Nanopelagicales bacterium]